MTLAATIERNRHAAKNERPRCDQAMHVVTDTDAKHTERKSWVFGLCTLYFVLWALLRGAGSQEFAGFNPQNDKIQIQIQISKIKIQRTKFKAQSSKFKVQRRAFSNTSASARSSGVVILIFLALPSTTATEIPICSTNTLSSVTSTPAASSSPSFA